MEKNRHKAQILFCINLPPPVHGVSVMNDLIRNSSAINSVFSCAYLNLGTASSIADLQHTSLKKALLTVRLLLKTAFKLFFKRFHLIYITPFPSGPAFVKDSLIILIAKLCGQKVLLHLHTVGYHKAAKASPLLMWYYKLVFKNTKVILVAESQKQDIEAIYFGEPVILPNGIVVSQHENCYTTGKNLIPELLFFSNLISGKGIFLFLEAAALLKKRGVSFRLVIAGAEYDVTYDMVKQKLMDFELTDCSTLIGLVSAGFKEELYKGADLFVLPTNYDTFGLVILEAMQYGVPCISTQTGAIPEILGEGRGRVISDFDPETFANVLQE